MPTQTSKLLFVIELSPLSNCWIVPRVRSLSRLCCWCRLGANPGDAPSRNKQISDWLREVIPRIFHTRRLQQESAATCEELAFFDQYRSENAQFEEQLNTKLSSFTKRKFEILESVRRGVSQKRRRHHGKGRRLCLDLFVEPVVSAWPFSNGAFSHNVLTIRFWTLSFRGSA